MKRPVEFAREFIRAVDALNIPGLMMSTHDRGKEAMARAIVALADAHRAGDTAQVQRLLDSLLCDET